MSDNNDYTGVQTGTSESDYGSGNDSPEVIEANVLQGREIGLLGAISLIVNKIIGAGYYLVGCAFNDLQTLTLAQDFLHSCHDLQT